MKSKTRYIWVITQRIQEVVVWSGGLTPTNGESFGKRTRLFGKMSDSGGKTLRRGVPSRGRSIAELPVVIRTKRVE